VWIQQCLLCTPHHNQEVEGAFNSLDHCRHGNEADKRLQARQLSIFNKIKPLREEGQRATGRSKVLDEDGTFLRWEPSAMQRFYQRRAAEEPYTAVQWAAAECRVREAPPEQSAHQKQLVKASQQAAAGGKKGRKRRLLSEAEAAQAAQAAQASCAAGGSVGGCERCADAAWDCTRAENRANEEVRN
jgi:hypothetical protein